MKRLAGWSKCSIKETLTFLLMPTTKMKFPGQQKSLIKRLADWSKCSIKETLIYVLMPTMMRLAGWQKCLTKMLTLLSIARYRRR